MAEKNNLIEVLYIIRECSRQLQEKGVKYWNNSLIDYNDIADDIALKHVFLLQVNRVSVGTITIKPDPADPTTTTISRLAIYPAFQKRGFAREMLMFAENTARNQKSKLVKGYIPIDDQSLCALLEEHGFVRKGSVSIPTNEYQRISFELELR